MANNNENILDKARTAGLARPQAGMSVPDGYFEAFADRMTSRLPERPELLVADTPSPQRSFWTAVRPYVYMAAMFAGVWCMLHIFHSLSGKGELAPMDSNPVLASALATDDLVYDYVLTDVSARDVVDQFMDDGLIDEDFDMDEFSQDLAVDADTNQILPQ
ncbi:MAG: hypothetical protein K1W01_07175 [Muribaculaceae bacterium]